VCGEEFQPKRARQKCCDKKCGWRYQFGRLGRERKAFAALPPAGEGKRNRIDANVLH